MLNELSRRAFLSDAALVSAASALKLHSATHASLVPSPPRRANFDQDWRFLLGDPQDAYSPAFMDAAWNPVHLPHDWSIEGAFSEDAPAKGNGAYLPTGIGWYRKSFTLPTSAAGKQVELEFDGVYERSEVWINGVSLGMRPYGFISFAYDLTPHLAPHGRPNHVAVRVDNSLQPNCRWYSGSGIYRHTWLRIVNPLHIARSGVYITTPLVSAHNAHIEFATVVHNQGNIPVSFDLLTEIVDAEGTVVQQTATSHDLAGSTEDTFDGSMVVASPSLWSPSSPSLYQARSTLRQHGAAVDQETTAFGIREAVFDVNLGLLLNGEHVKMNGVCIHGDGGSVGTAVPERV